ncbi:MAG: hypothetical protein ACRETN_01310, partial [Nevskiales bacterium]
TTPAANFHLSGQGTLDPVNSGGTVDSLCSERAVLATDSGINGIYSVSVEETTGIAGMKTFTLRMFVDDATSFTFPVTATFDICAG